MAIHHLTIGLDAWHEYRNLDGIYCHKEGDARIYIEPRLVSMDVSERTMTPKITSFKVQKHIVAYIRHKNKIGRNHPNFKCPGWQVGDEVKFKVEP